MHQVDPYELWAFVSRHITRDESHLGPDPGPDADAGSSTRRELSSKRTRLADLRRMLTTHNEAVAAWAVRLLHIEALPYRDRRGWQPEWLPADVTEQAEATPAETTVPLAARLDTAARRLTTLTRAATPGPWRTAADAGVLGANYPDNFVGNWDGEYLHGVASVGDGDQAETDAAYITRMHPEVGRALADLLNAAAAAADIHPDEPPRNPRDRLVIRAAARVAHALESTTEPAAREERDSP